MKYESPQLTLSAPAIKAIHSGKTKIPHETPETKDAVSAYEDWED